MLKDEIEKTLQAHSPEPPEGFAERTDNKVISLMQKKQERNAVKGKSRYRLPVLAAAAVLALCIMTAATRELIIRPDAIRARETTTPLVTALSEGHGEATGSAALSEDAAMCLGDEYPGLINELKPVNLSSEQQGVRFDLIYALIKDQELYMLYSIRDMEGERVGNGGGVTTFYDDNFNSGNRGQSILRLSYDETEHKGTYLRKCELDRPVQAAEQVRMSFRDLGVSETLYVDLNAQLEQYGKTTEGITLPEDITTTSDNPDFLSDVRNKTVLDYTQPLDEPLWGAVRLTGIGWIDNKLHVQIHNPDASVTSIGRGNYSSWSIVPGALITDGEGSRDVDCNTLSWGYTEEKEPTWQEYVWEISPDEKEHLNLRAYVTHITKTLDAKWEFKVPVDTILAETATPMTTALPESREEDPVTKALREEIGGWVSSSEDIVDELKPVNLSYETQGIRVDILSALVKGSELWLVYSAQDLEGDRIGSYTRDSEFGSVSVNQNYRTPEDETYETLTFSEEDRKITYVRRFGFDQRIEPENGMIELEFGKFQLQHDETVDLTGYLRQYGNRAKGVKPPDGAKGFGGYLQDEAMVSWKDAKILDSSNPLDIQVFKDIYLTAIGWTDDQMHAQFRCMDREENTDGSIPAGYLSVWIMPGFSGEKNFQGYGTVEWKPEDGSNTKWIDETVNCTREEAESMKLSADVMEYIDVVDDCWTIQIPYDEIKAGAVQEEEPAEQTALSKEGEAFLAHVYPGLMEELKPVNLSCEKQGIRAEVIYALIKDQKLYVVYSLQDLEDDRIKDNSLTFYLDNLGGTGLYSMRLGWDETEEHKATFLKVYDIPETVQTDGKLAVNLIGLMNEEDTMIDLLPLLKKYGKTVKGVDKPEGIEGEAWDLLTMSDVDLSKYPTILDYKQPLDESLEGPVSLTGIGWIDNRLHVQIRNTDAATVTMGDTTYPSWMCSPGLTITDGEDRRLPGYDVLSWNSVSGRQTPWKEYMEYVWEITPDDMEHLDLDASVSHFEKTLDTTWKIEIPVASILEETDKDTAAQEAETTAEALPLGEEINRRIEEKWPGITKELKPVNMICDRQGIRLEVTSALVKGNKSWFVFSLQDLEEDRISMDSVYYVDMWNCNGNMSNVASMEWQYLYSSESEHKIAYAVCMEYKDAYKSEDNDYIVQYKGIGVTKQTSLDLLPLLEKYGNATESIEAPAEVISAYSSGNFGESLTRKGMKILDYTKPLDVELGKDVCLTGIGWIDNQLHVQISDGQQYELVIGQQYFNPLYCSVGAYFPGQPDDQLDNVDEVYWRDGETERREYVFNCRPDQADNLDLHANMTEITDVVRDNWEVRIPLESILAEDEGTTGKETAAPAV